MLESILIRGARQHNLKGIDLDIPRHKLTVVTGPSGSGKSSLAFDTLYAEGQRRYVESLSAYARQFLDQMGKPDVDRIEGLSPAIAIEQRTTGANPRSTVATTTEIYDYLRLLYAHAGTPHCHKCGREVRPQSVEAIKRRLEAVPEGRRMMVLSPRIDGRKGARKDIFERVSAEGFVRVRVDGEVYPVDSPPDLDKNKRHTIEVVVDRLLAGETDSSRLVDAVETALEGGDGKMILLVEDEKGGWDEEMISERAACVDCGVSFEELAPRNFSFNSPYGACRECHGLGAKMVFDEELLIPDPSLSMKKGAIPAWRRGPRRLIIYYNHLLRRLSEHLDFPALTTTPIQDLPRKIRETLLYGTGDESVNFDFWMRGKLRKMEKPFEGVIPNLERRFVETESDSVRERLRKMMRPKTCPACGGARLKPESLAVTVGGVGIHQFNAMTVEAADAFMEVLPGKLSAEDTQVARGLVREIRARLGFLADVGLGYLTLDRGSGTLSGGEAQRIRLATQIGSGLTGVLYILDEPSIGLHQSDNDKLLDTLARLRDTGNTVVVVEHDLDTIRRADFVVDLGPGAGRHGGELVASGSVKDVMASKKSLTGDYLVGRKRIAIPKERSAGVGKSIRVKGARHNNLKNVDVEIPLGTLCCVTGVSGSGKSSLVDDILRVGLERRFGIGHRIPGEHDSIEGLEEIGKAIVIDQSPIGRTPRSNPATYTDAFSTIRQLFAKLPEARARGYKPGRFSFNVKGGRCEECRGDGEKKIEMQFLPDVYVTCSMCGGRRFNEDTLGIIYKGKNIADVLEMTVDEALAFFAAVPALARKLETLSRVGLGYIHLGQPATTLSGGEAQRVKLAAELAKIPRGHTIYILDEPTTGLHTHDVRKLLEVLLMLRDKGNTVLVVEHNLEMIKVADHIIDLGPDGGDAGGEIVAAGTPEKVASVPKSRTGACLKDVGVKPARGKRAREA